MLRKLLIYVTKNDKRDVHIVKKLTDILLKEMRIKTGTIIDKYIKKRQKII
uniref:Uncharacterized protein n=1 Tax=viral metagenome TaxID=1070528 RepID=A0A6C0J3V7_9ZZZZ